MSYYLGSEPIPGYRLEGKLGEGGAGKVFRASAPGGREVALKIMDLGSESLGRKEWRALHRMRKIRHARLVEIHGSWIKDERGVLLTDKEVEQLSHGDDHGARLNELIIAMTLCDKTLEKLLSERKEAGDPGIDRVELMKYVTQAAEALDYLNEPREDSGSGTGGFQHCDIKPSNILLLGQNAYVGDFGLVREINERRTSMTRTMAATPKYAAPEIQINPPRPSRTTDQYMLAVTYYELLTGHLPFKNEGYNVIENHLSGRLVFSDVTDRERDVLKRATALNPDNRYRSCGAFVQALEDAARPTTPPVTPPSVDTQKNKRPPSLPGIIGPGTIIGTYKLIDLLGSGGYGQVWKAEAPGGFPAALKIISLAKFQGMHEWNGLQVMKKLTHPHLLTLRGCWLLNDTQDEIPESEWGTMGAGRAALLVIASDLANESLAHCLERHVRQGARGIPVEDLLHYVEQAAEAIDYLNLSRNEYNEEAPIVHRDIKPENILLRDGGYVQVADFGLVMALEKAQEGLTRSRVAYTIAYAAPEFFRWSVNKRSDQCSLALTYYKLRTDNNPFLDGAETEYAIREAHEQRQLSFGGVPPEVAAVLEQATRYDPEGRYESCKIMVRELRRCELKGLSKRGTEPSPQGETTPWPLPEPVDSGSKGSSDSRKKTQPPVQRPMLWALVTSLCLVIAVGGVVALVAKFIPGTNDGGSTPTAKAPPQSVAELTDVAISFLNEQKLDEAKAAIASANKLTPTPKERNRLQGLEAVVRLLQLSTNVESFADNLSLFNPPGGAVQENKLQLESAVQDVVSAAVKGVLDRLAKNDPDRTKEAKYQILRSFDPVLFKECLGSLTAWEYFALNGRFKVDDRVEERVKALWTDIAKTGDQNNFKKLLDRLEKESDAVQNQPLIVAARAEAKLMRSLPFDSREKSKAIALLSTPGDDGPVMPREYKLYVLSLLLNDQNQDGFDAASLLQKQIPPDSPTWEWLTKHRIERAIQVLQQGAASRVIASPDAKAAFQHELSKPDGAEHAWAFLDLARRLLERLGQWDNASRSVRADYVLAALGASAPDTGGVYQIAKQVLDNPQDAMKELGWKAYALAQKWAAHASNVDVNVALSAYDAALKLWEVSEVQMQPSPLDLKSHVLDRATKLILPAGASAEAKIKFARFHGTLGDLLRERPGLLGGSAEDAARVELACFNTALENDKSRAAYHFGHGSALCRSGKPDDKLDRIRLDAKETKDRDATHPGAHQLLGYVCYLEAGKARAAERMSEFQAKMKVARDEYGLAIDKAKGPKYASLLPKLQRNQAQALIELANHDFANAKTHLVAAEKNVRSALQSEYAEKDVLRKQLGIILEDQAWLTGDSDKYSLAIEFFKSTRELSREVAFAIGEARCCYKYVAFGRRADGSSGAVGNLADTYRKQALECLEQILVPERREEVFGIKTLETDEEAEALFLRAKFYLLTKQYEEARSALALAEAWIAEARATVWQQQVVMLWALSLIEQAEESKPQKAEDPLVQKIIATQKKLTEVSPLQVDLRATAALLGGRLNELAKKDLEAETLYWNFVRDDKQRLIERESCRECYVRLLVALGGVWERIWAKNDLTTKPLDQPERRSDRTRAVALASRLEEQGNTVVIFDPALRASAFGVAATLRANTMTLSNSEVQNALDLLRRAIATAPSTHPASDAWHHKVAELLYLQWIKETDSGRKDELKKTAPAACDLALNEHATFPGWKDTKKLKEKLR